MTETPMLMLQYWFLMKKNKMLVVIIKMDLLERKG